MDQKKPPKRLDLQGIRALAIIAVIGFHFFPEYVPNGYLGVDQFFVLSGFLMCMLLKRAQNEPACSLIAIFYSKRFKRIFPLYILIIAVSIIALYTVFPESAIETNRESAVSALFFVSNRPKTEAEAYFQMLSMAIDIFTHTWSLSVEVQFYLLVPFIFLIGKGFSTKYQLTFYVILASFSYLFSIFSPPTLAFHSVFARIWQFLIGFLVHQQGFLEEKDTEKLLEEKEELPETSPLFPDLLLIALLLMTMCPFELPADFLRPLVTVITGLLMLVSERSSVLSNPVLTYLGDISYSLYLIHWPIYAYWKLTASGDQHQLRLALISSIMLAIIFYETFEKWYLHLSSTGVTILIIILLLLNVVLINKDHIQYTFTNLEDPARINAIWNQDDNKNLFSPTCDYEKPKTPFGWCRHQGLSPNGQYKLTIIGNSWAANHGTLFYQECGNSARSILQGSAIGCEPLYPSKNLERCLVNMLDIEEQIQKEQPDYAFILTLYVSTADPMPENVTELDQDPIYQIMRDQTRKLLANIKHKLFILDAIPKVFIDSISQIVPMLKEHKRREDIDKALINTANFDLARKRHAQLVKEFEGRVVLVDYKPEFYNNSTKTFRYFDERGLSYFTTGNHLTPYGLEHVRHVWKDICSKL